MSGCEIVCLQSDDIRLHGCCWSPDGERLATVGYSQFLRIWDWQDHRMAAVIDVDAEILACCAWSPDGRGVLCGQGKDRLALWGINTGSALWSIGLESRFGVGGCALSPDGRFLGVTSGSRLIFCRVDSSSDEPVIVLAKDLGMVSQGSCSFSGDGKQFAYAAGSVSVLNTGDGSWQPIDNTLAMSCCLSPDGKNLVVGGGVYGFASLDLYDAESGQWLGDLQGHQDLVNSCDWSPDGRWIASASRDGTVKVWDASIPWDLVGTRHHSFGAIALAWNADGSQVLSAGRDGRAHLWDPESGSLLSTVELRDRSSVPKLTGCDFSGDGSAFVLSDDQGVLEVFDARRRSSVWEVQDDEKQTRDCAWSPVADRIASCGTAGVRIRDARTGHLSYLLEGTEEATRLGFSPDGRLLATHSRSSVLVFDAETGSRLSEIDAVNRALYWGEARNELSWSADSSLLLAGDRDLTVVVIEPLALRAIGRLAGHKGFHGGSAYFGRFGQSAEVLCAFTDRRRFAVTACVDGLVKVWDVDEGKLLAQFATDAAFWCLAARGERLCLGDDQGYLHWFTLENLPDDDASPLLRPDTCDQCGDLMERQESSADDPVWWQCRRCRRVRQ
jgi:WD40 repeat protein